MAEYNSGILAQLLAQQPSDPVAPQNRRLSELLRQSPDMPATANLGMLAQGLRARDKPPLQMQTNTLQGLLDAGAMATSPFPFIGDAVGLGADLNRYANEPESRTLGNFGLTAAGLLPMVPNMGMFKKGALSADKMPTTRTAFTPPAEVANKLTMPSPHTALYKDDLYLKFIGLPDGKYLAEYSPAWGSTSKGFHGYGDDLGALVSAAEQRIANSNRAVSASQTAKHKNSLAGKLEAEFGEGAFDVSKSERSKSQYFTHTPSGTKIRISDHALPLGYVQADLDLPAGMSADDMAKAITEYLRK